MNPFKELYDLAHDPEESVNQNCKNISARLGINWKYYYQLAFGHKTGSKRLTKLAEGFSAMLTKAGKVKRAYKPRLVVSYDDEDQHQKHMVLSNEERREAFDLYQLNQKKKLRETWEDYQNLLLEHRSKKRPR